MTIRRPGNNPFSAAYLERRGETRLDPQWPHSALAVPSTRFILSHGTRHLMRRAPGTGIAFVDAAHPAVQRAQPSQLILLGWYRDAPCVLVEVETEESGLTADAEFEELRPLLAALPPEEAGLLACARALLIWRARHRHCGVCGAPTAPRNAGHVLRCTSSACGEEFFPRIDPAIIVLVTDGAHALLGRQASWPAGRYSALAGFVEVGESLEDAVAREVHEETGVRIRTTQYFGSQPWPFPASLMLGFHARSGRAARAAGADVRAGITLNGELEDARWFSAAQLQHAAPGMLPPPHTIARQLLETWFAAPKRSRNRKPPAPL
jgi:NAD+ diphosphatase